MEWYRVTYLCPTCGKVHRVSNMRRIPDGPDQAGTVAELWPSGKLPTVVAGKLHHAVWCETLGEYVISGAAGPDKMIIRPLT